MHLPAGQALLNVIKGREIAKQDQITLSPVSHSNRNTEVPSSISKQIFTPEAVRSTASHGSIHGSDNPEPFVSSPLNHQKLFF